MIFSSVRLPPAAAHPATGGNAPTSEPGSIARANFLFNGVYMKLYETYVAYPINSVVRFVPVYNANEPVTNNAAEIKRALPADILPAGNGLPIVRSISPSYFLS